MSELLFGLREVAVEESNRINDTTSYHSTTTSSVDVQRYPQSEGHPVQPANLEPLERKRGRPTEAGRIERQEQILDAALANFLEYGFGNATVDRIAADARVTKRTIYNYFGNKDGVFTEMQGRLAETVSGDSQNRDTLESLAARIVFRLHSAQMIGLHRLVIAESLRFPDLARTLHDNGDMRHVARLAEHINAERGQGATNRAEALYALLLGEDYRRRLLGLLEPITAGAAADYAHAALAHLGLTDVPER
ncbi:TetR/AcrR family transcriptional regulator [Cryobacterium sp. MDB1-18-2]|uniref:TetR/AcrR family transcriptional regulator n=1 Tax=Cryobacterium glucosi TaxID=1259175 RepID=A0ABY2ISJ1_9MICO|nr:TetR/AcrR family transcriptional regulator [Cryobacterium sp. MDB2-A-1]TFC01810.1 TetR/AcrR family transcriptional regulator [Cryobacterium sp. MDB2-33-2]TFC10345.1 TetR/AcrR family transcriptional regulator [Cryobacterium sp. MDB2-A-2]TFC12404.1 TetR/AcrR family transcriptional regulator [Cryobacterium sp. MDB2-10]TFC23457.1 TetR/AcrR family transcriptional regulator [Cryobacterium sp. MDB1-18-2]TFC23955.1 TetR/AcrR family transcriptional regulator [Cryobacterium glucosi]TFC43867.1 TetR/A